MNGVTSVVVMIETIAALDNLEEIVAVEGVDMLLIGSNDLGAEIGIAGSFDHPRLKDVFARSIAATRTAGKHVGVEVLLRAMTC
jgi:4-hydroxy-2-oxoheptanedioate aldolase